MDVKNFGTAASTTEGWSAVLLMLLGVAKQFDFIPADMEPAAIIASTVVLVNLVTHVVKKITRKGSVPFVADAPKP